MARLLLEHGFNVTGLYGDAITPDEAGSLEWFRENFPDIPFRSTANFRARFYGRNEAGKYGGHLLAIGPKAAYFTGTKHFVNMMTRPMTNICDSPSCRKTSENRAPIKGAAA